MEIKSINYPYIQLQLTDSKSLNIDFVKFLDEIAPDPSNPYRQILDKNIFVKAYIKHGKLVWGQVLELKMCGGDSMMMSAEFSEKELIVFAKK